MSLKDFFQVVKGGAGSGNFGHSGVPGKHGGSAPKGGGGMVKKLQGNLKDVAEAKYYPNSKQAKITFTRPYPDTLNVVEALKKAGFEKTTRRSAQTQDTIWEHPNKTTAVFNTTNQSLDIYDKDYQDRGGKNPFLPYEG